MTLEPGTAWDELKAQLDAWAEHRLPGGALAINREVAKTLVDHNRPAIEAEARAAVLAEVLVYPKGYNHRRGCSRTHPVTHPCDSRGLTNEQWDRVRMDPDPVAALTRSAADSRGLDVEWQKSLLKYYADTMPGFAAAAGLSRDEYAAVMVDVKRARREYAALTDPEPAP